MQLGERWFFRLEDGTKAEILYLVEGRFQSRKSARLTYRTQAAGPLDQQAHQPRQAQRPA
jgi:hypothetical protein